MKKTILQECIRLSLKKISRHPEKKCYLHFAYIVSEGKIASWGWNSAVEPPVHYGYHELRDKNFKPKFHAEISAYKRAKRLFDRFEIVNIRMNKNGDLKLSHPCKCCYGLMKALGCKRFYYSSDMGFLKLDI